LEEASSSGKVKKKKKNLWSSGGSTVLSSETIEEEGREESRSALPWEVLQRIKKGAGLANLKKKRKRNQGEKTPGSRNDV